MRKTNLKWLMTFLMVFGLAFYGNAQTVFEDDFSTDQGWTTSGSWQRATAVLEPATDNSGDGFILANPLGADYPANATREDVLSPVIDCSAYTTNIELRYWSFSGCESKTYDHIGVEVFDGTAWVEIWTNTTTSFQETEWTLYNFDVTTQAAGNANFQARFFVGTSDGSVQYSGFAIDDFSVTNITCPDPSAQTVANITINSATLSWVSGGASNYNIVYGPSGFAASDSTAIALTDTFYNASNLNSETNYDFYVQDSCGVGDVSFWVGPFQFTTLISCPAPTAQNVSDITLNSATLSWVSGGATNYNVLYGPIGFNTVDSTAIALTDTFYVVSGLSSSTDYEFYVQDSCGLGDASSWVGPYPFSTLCGVEIPEYTVDFSTFLPNCWEETQGILAEPTITTGTTSNWIVDGFGNVGSTGSARMNVYSTTPKEWLISNSIDLGTSNNYQLEFDLALTDYANAAAPDQNGTDDKFAVVISTDAGVTWNLSDALKLWDNAGSTDVYNDIPHTGTHVVIDLSTYTGVVKIGFYAESTVSNADNDLFIDNFKVRETPNCPEPFSLTTTDVTMTSATFSWTPFGSETEWNIEYDTTGFTLGTGTDVAATDTFINVSTLSPGVTYDFYVQAVCGLGDESIWSGPYTFLTPSPGDNCANAAQVSLPADFIANVYQDLSQTTVNRGNSNDTTCLDYYDGGEDIFYELTLASDMVINVELDPKTTTYTGIALTSDCPSMTNCIETSTNSSAGTHGFQQVSLVAGTYFIMIDTWPSPNNIPDFDLTISLVTCPNPMDLTAELMSGTSANLSWTTGGATTWDIEWGTSGFTPTEVPTITTTDNPYLLSGLSEETSYQYYVRDYCSASDTSEWIGPFTFTTTASCPDPIDLTVDNITYNSADLGWDGFFATHWDIELDTAGFTPTGTPTENDVTVNPFNYTGLDADTDFEFYVRADCGQDNIDTSNWVGPFTFTTDVTCPAPIGLIASNIQADEATVSWVSGGATDFNIVYGTEGFDITTGAIVDVADTFFTVTTLTSNTNYDFYVRDSCGVGDVSVWVGPFQFSTLCDANTVYPYIESFETGAISVCWNSENVVGTSLLWSVETSGTSPAVSPYDGSNLLKLNCYSSSLGETRLSAVNFDLAGLTAPFLDFYMVHDDGYTTSDDRVIVQISTDGVTWNNIDTISRYQAISATWTQYSYDLSAYIGQTIKVGLYGITEYGNNIFIDKFMIYNQTTDLTVVNPGNEDYSSCDYTGQDTIPFFVKNNGTSVIPANDTIFGWYEIDAAVAVADTFVLSTDLNPNDTAYFDFTQTADLAGLTSHDFVVYLNYNADEDETNDTTMGTFTHYVPSVSITQGDTVILNSSDFPYMLNIVGVYDEIYWYNADSSLTGTNVQFVINDFGWYYVSVLDNNGCPAIDSILVENATGISYTDNSLTFEVYPNPSNGQFFINATFVEKQDVRVDIIDINGKVVYSNNYNGVDIVRQDVDIKNFAKGIYYIRVSNDKMLHQEKIVVQ